MSGCTGANRINKVDVDRVTQDYVFNVLRHYPYFKSYNHSGSYVVGKKDSYGDIDLVVEMETDMDKKTLKKHFGNWLKTNFPNKTIQPFSSEKHRGKRIYNAGELITIKYPQDYEYKQSVQIDNIIALSEEERDFKTNFLNLPAEIQGLYLGIIKTILLEIDKQQVFTDLNIDVEIDTDYEYEFNLSPIELQLRKVQTDKDYKTLSSEVVWSTQNWGSVIRLLSYKHSYTSSNDFYWLVNNIKNNYTHERSLNRVKGLFKSMVNIKSGEVGTEKGNKKQECLDVVNNM